MPLYDYECVSCGSKTTRKMKMLETTPTILAFCSCSNKPNLFNKIIRPIPIIFKGKGWPDKTA